MSCTTDCGSDRSEIPRGFCILCGTRTTPHRSRLRPCGLYVCVKCAEEQKREITGGKNQGVGENAEGGGDEC